MIKRASIFVFSFAVLLTLISFGVLLAQEKFQTKPITILVPYESGGSTDITTRALSEAAGKFFGQPIIVQKQTWRSQARQILALVLGPMMESALCRSLTLSDGSSAIFFRRPIALVFMAASFLAFSHLCFRRSRRAQAHREHEERLIFTCV